MPLNRFTIDICMENSLVAQVRLHFVACVGSLPIVFSLLSDMFEQQHRAVVSSMVQVAVGIGIAAGQGLAGYLGPQIGWQWPFVAVAAPAVCSAVIMYTTTTDPELGCTENVVRAGSQDSKDHIKYEGELNVKKLRALLTIKTNVLAIGQGLPGCLPWGMLLTFLNDYLAQEKGLSVSAATSLVLGIGIGGAIGVIGGGIIGQILYNKRPRLMSIFIGVCTILGTIPLWGIIVGDVSSHFTWAFILSVLVGIMSSTVGPNVRAMIMNVNEPESRGVALALQTTLDDLGKGLGPVIVASMISTLGRDTAFFWATAGWIPCGILLLLTSFTLVPDEKAMHCRMRATVSYPNFDQRSELEMIGPRTVA